MRIVRKYKYPLTITIIILIAISSIIIKNKLNNDKYNDIITEDIELKETKTEEIKETLCMVDIKGAVNNPGVYQVNCDKHVEDIINMAGNLTENADTSLINLAKKITDEMVIIIYTKEEIINFNNKENVNKVIDNECVCPEITNDSLINVETSDNELININTASLEELKKIPGIGESKARAIISYRTNNGKFTVIEDIKKVNGIGDKLYEQIKIYITT